MGAMGGGSKRASQDGLGWRNAVGSQEETLKDRAGEERHARLAASY